MGVLDLSHLDSREDGYAQDDIALIRATHVLHGDVRAVGGILTETKQVGGVIQTF